MRLVVASKNPGKMREFLELAQKSISSKLQLELARVPDEFGPEEVGITFEDNSEIKAVEAARLTKSLSIADDSGLVIDALGGAPGVLSARYCEGSDADRRLRVLSEMQNVPIAGRSARFICAMTLCSGDGTILSQVQGVWHGRIGLYERGRNGFGYDSIFFLKDRDVSAAELTPDEKNRLSHRALAWQQILSYFHANPYL